MEVGLDFDDILITPKRTKISSRSEVDLDVVNNSFFSGIPLFVANMDGIGTMEVAKVMSKNNMFTCLVKTYSADEIIEFFRTEKQSYYNVAMSIGIASDDINKLHKVMSVLYANNEIRYLCVDVANGYMENFVHALKYINEHYPNLEIIAGNVATADGVEQIAPYISACKVGLGSGSLCRSRTKTGVGVPQVTAIIHCAKKCQEHGIFLISDGGCKEAGDIAKAFAVGADGVMMGTMLSGTTEGGGEIITKTFNTNEVKVVKCHNGIMNVTEYEPIYETKQFVQVYGMSSKTANNKHFGGMKSYRSSEGITALVPYKGDIQDVVNEILGGLRSACSYSNAETLEKFMNSATWSRCNNTHSKMLDKYKIGD